MKNKSPQIIMSASLILLIGFQLYWLNSLYKEEVKSFKQQTNYAFDNTIRSLKAIEFDTQFKRSMNLYKNTESTKKNEKHKKAFKLQSTNMQVEVDSLEGLKGFNPFEEKEGIKNSKDFKVSLSVKDKEKEKEKPFEGTQVTISESTFKSGNQKITFNILNKIIKNELITNYYKIELKKLNISVPFVVKRIPHKDSLKVSKYYTTQIPGDYPFHFNYAAEFDNYFPTILKKITPQIIFSCLLLSLISLAYYLIYNNLQNQKRLNAIKNDFIGNVTHELKTPITTVGVALEALQSFDVSKDTDKAKEYIGIAQNELNRLSVLVDKVLKMSVFEQQGVTSQMEEVDLNEIIEKVLKSTQLTFEKVGAIVNFTKIGNNFKLQADPTHITNVVYNLIDNALKYSTIRPKIDLELTEINDNISFSIADNGIGIEQAYQTKVFDKFFRVPTGDAHTIKGYGLGLNYVQSVVNEHGGKITFTSEFGKGSKFEVTLPKNIEIKINDKNLSTGILSALVFVIAGVWIIYHSIYQNKIFLIGILGLISILFFGTTGVFIFKKMIDSKKGLVINNLGIFDNSTASSVGFVPWIEIIDIKLEKVLN